MIRPFTAALLVILLSLQPLQAQRTSGWIDGDRANSAVWETAGSTLIDEARTQCGETMASTSTAAQINSQVAGCSANTYVLLDEGTFSLSAGLVLGVNNVTLRGSGPDSTILNFTGEDACGGLSAIICAGDPDAYIDIFSDDAPNHRGWTAGFTPGTATVTLSSAPTNLSVGDIVLLDQQSDPCSERGDHIVFTTVEISDCTVEGGGTFMRKPTGENTRALAQYSVVTAINGSDLDIEPPIITPGFRDTEDPEVSWEGVRPAEGIGIENLRFNGNSADAQWNVMFMACKDCWVRNVHGMNSDRGQVMGFQNVRLTVRDSYFWSAKAGASQSYGIEVSSCTNCLIENNIVHAHVVSVMLNGPALGNVVSYNFMFNQRTDFDEMISSTWLHEGGTDSNLFEGNILYPGVRADDIHGTHNAVTYLRNYMSGRDTFEDKQGTAILIQPSSRIFNFLGNVAGTDGLHDEYQGNDFATNIWAVGNADDTVSADTQTGTTLYRYCNYDTVNAAVRTESSEVPTGLSEYAQTVPSAACSVLPPSFYADFATLAPWWNTPSGQPPFPPIGPEVTGGDLDIDEPANASDTDLGGHVYKIPAYICYENCSKDGNGMCTDFDAATCYSQATVGVPPVEGYTVNFSTSIGFAVTLP